MARMTKEQKAFAARVDRVAQAAVDRIPIPILKIPGLYKFAEDAAKTMPDDVALYNAIRGAAILLSQGM